METTWRNDLHTCCLISSADIAKKATAHSYTSQSISSLQLHCATGNLAQVPLLEEEMFESFLSSQH